MQIVRLGNRVLGVLAKVRELAARGIFLQELEAEALLHLVEQVCKKEDVHNERTDEVELCVGREEVTLLCFLLPPKRECFLFEGLGEALDGLAGADIAAGCALFRTEKGYVISVPSEGCAVRLSEFGLRLGDREGERACAQGELLAEGKALRAIFRKKRGRRRKE